MGKPQVGESPKPPARHDFHASFILWDSSVFVLGFASVRVFFGAHPPLPQRASLQRDESHYFRPNRVWRDLLRRRGEGEVLESGMGAWC